jgi:hypothetical protein
MKDERERLIERRNQIYMNTGNAKHILEKYDEIIRTIEKVQKSTAHALET